MQTSRCLIIGFVRNVKQFHQKCVKCHRIYASYTSMINHIRQGCEETIGPDNSCSKCKKDFKNSAALGTHVKFCGK